MKYKNCFAALLLTIGFFTIINSEFAITGAFAGVVSEGDLMAIAGFIAIFLGVLLFVSGELEKKSIN